MASKKKSVPIHEAIGTACPRPMRELVVLLPALVTNRRGEIDYARSDRALVAVVEQNAETIASALHMGLGAIGHLLAISAPQIEDGSVSSDVVEALGWLMAELGDLGASLTVIAMRCRARVATQRTRTPAIRGRG